MKITKSQLKKLISEEIEKALKEAEDWKPLNLSSPKSWWPTEDEDGPPIEDEFDSEPAIEELRAENEELKSKIRELEEVIAGFLENT